VRQQGEVDARLIRHLGQAVDGDGSFGELQRGSAGRVHAPIMGTAYNRSMDGDEALLRRAEATLAEIDRNQGLSDVHAEVLAAIRIRIDGAPRKSLDDVLRAAGTLKGKRSLDDPPPPPAKASFEDALKKASTKKDWPGL
jgi:hypothetical protein